MLTERYTAYLAQLAERNSLAAQLAGIVFLFGLVAITAQGWPEAIRPWSKRIIIIMGVSIYATLFVVGVESLLGRAGPGW